MIAEVTTAALMSENKHLANPARRIRPRPRPTRKTMSPWPPMAHAACKRMNDNLNVIIGVEADVCGAGRRVPRTARHIQPGLLRAVDLIRADVPR
jgi:histidine ammonia-lyase